MARYLIVRQRCSVAGMLEKSLPRFFSASSASGGNKLWAGRFDGDTDKLTDEYNESVSFDKRLAFDDIRGSIAHANMLHKCDIIDSESHKSILSGLGKIKSSIEAGEFEWRQDREDVHMNIEATLTEMVGDAGARLHTARSRNDQVATDLRLHVRQACDDTIAELKNMRRVLLELSEQESRTVMPGYTHLQRAQPILLSHHLHAYEEMFARDTERMLQARERMNLCPLGSGALAGVAYDVDRHMVAEELEFSCVTKNSLDAVSDRDFLIDFHSAAALTMVHISRMAEEIIMWASGEFNYINLDHRFSTSSSIMPQKKNPDVAELGRGKSARVIGNLVQSLVMIKGQALAYNKDNQEGGESVFDSMDTVKVSLRVFAAMLPTIKFNRDVMREASVANFALATDYADFLAARNVPFREAHHAVGAIVGQCEKTGRTLDDLSLKELQEVHPSFDEDALSICLESSLAARSAIGGTAPETVDAARKAALMRIAREQLQEELAKSPDSIVQ